MVTCRIVDGLQHTVSGEQRTAEQTDRATESTADRRSQPAAAAASADTATTAAVT